MVDPAIDALLDELESAGEDLRDFQARMSYEKADALTGAELRYGRVVYRRGTEGGSTLGLWFDEYVDASGRMDKVDELYVFTEGWLVEVDAARKQFIKRQIVPPGKTFDPLKLGEGPFPLPVGQRKAEVLARFLVSEAPPPSSRLLSGLEKEDLRTLRLVPLPGTRESRDFESVDLYYDRATLLPVGVVAAAPDKSVKTVRLRGLQRNEGLAEELLAKLSVATPDPREWIIDIRPWSGDE